LKKILLDIYLAKNLGDDIFLDLFARKFPDIEITVYYPGSDYNDFLDKYKNVHAFNYTFKDKIVRKLKLYDKLTDYKTMAQEFDALVFLGGGIFREEEYEKSLFEYRLQIVSAFKDKRKPTYFLGCNFGPFYTQNYIGKHIELFKKCEDICFRDLESFNLFKDLKNVRYAPDIVWAYNWDNIVQSNNSKENNIGISVINPKHKKGLEHYYQEYVNEHISTIKKYLAENKNIYLFSFCEAEGDMEVINDINLGLFESELDKITVLNYESDITTYIKHMSNVSFFIGARFHSIILAMLMKIIVVPVIYNIKSKNLLTDIEFQNKIIDFDNLNFLSKENPTSNYIYPYIQNLKVEAEKHFSKFIKFVD
jgi:colanic acid/amylovoran biosynthesis protein